MTAPVNNAGPVAATGDLQITDNMDLDTIFMVLALDRAQTMDRVIGDMAADMKATNDRINKLNEAMSVVRSIRPDKKADESGKVTLIEEQKTALAVLEKEGVSMPSALNATTGFTAEQEALWTAQTYNGILSPYQGMTYEQAKTAIESSNSLTSQQKTDHMNHLNTRVEPGATIPNGPEAKAQLTAAKAAFEAAGGVGNTYKTLEGKPAAFDSLVENIKTKIDWLSSTSQLDMIKLQGMINKRNQVIEMASNVMQKIANSLNNLISNLR